MEACGGLNQKVHNGVSTCISFWDTLGSTGARRGIAAVSPALKDVRAEDVTILICFQQLLVTSTNGLY